MEIHRRFCLFHLRGGALRVSYRHWETYTHTRAKNASRFQIMQPERRGCPKLVRVTRATLKAGRRAGCGLVNTQRTEFANVLNLVGRLEHKPQSNHGSPHSHPPILPTEYLVQLIPSAFYPRIGRRGGGGGREGRRPRFYYRSVILVGQVEIPLWIFFSLIDLDVDEGIAFLVLGWIYCVACINSILESEEVGEECFMSRDGDWWLFTI